ncbi:NAD(+)/NADH kinase [bacterium]|nr:NAD(+)/NADH kinase [bacterium]
MKIDLKGTTPGVIINTTKPHAVKALEALIFEMEKRGVPFLLESASAISIGREGTTVSELNSRCQWLVVIGGDGTILSAVREMTDLNVPILGINPGESFGFLAEIPENEIAQTLDTILVGRCEIEERSLIEASYVGEGGVEKKERALNDLAFVRGLDARIIELKISVNGETLTTYGLDGLIMSTATGSTAYSLSAGGPVMYPGLEAFLMTPVCPHSFTNRPMLFPRGTKVEIENVTIGRPVHISADGRQTLTISTGEKVTVALGERVKFLTCNNHSFVQKLRGKMGWQGSLRETE